MNNKIGTEIKKWNAFIYMGKVYDLSHLDYHTLSFNFKKENKIFIIHVSYSFHCFAKNNAEMVLGSVESNELMYYAIKDKRHFNFERYDLSFKIKEILKKLEENPRCYNAGYDKFLSFDFSNEKKYIVCFDIFRENKKLRLHVKSAYPESKDFNIKKYDKTNIYSILNKVLTKNNKLPK